jgi:YD repeat-containing protein
MNKKYERYINYIVNDIEPPYFINMEEMYGLKPEEYKLILDKVFNQPIRINGNDVYDQNGNLIYHEDSTGYWTKKEYDNQGNLIYREDSDGSWVRYKYDRNGNKIYYEDSNGHWLKQEFDDLGNLIYRKINGYW